MVYKNNKKGYRIGLRAGQQGPRSPVRNQAGIEKLATGTPTNNNERKRKLSNLSPSPQHFQSNQKIPSFPRFFNIESTDHTDISTLSPFVIQKTLQSLIGTAKSIKRIKNKGLLVEIDRQTQSNLMAQITKFYDIPVKCYPHASLNVSKGVIRHRELAFVTEEELVENMTDQHVTAAKRIHIYRNNEKVEKIHSFSPLAPRYYRRLWSWHSREFVWMCTSRILSNAISV